MAVTSDLESKIIRQIEYYFGDHNLSRDKFLQEEIKKDEGWIPLEVMLKFNRLAQMSKEAEVIAGAVAKSTSGLLEVHEDKSKIRRNPERKIPDWGSDWKDEVQNRTLYMKGFPATAVLDDIMVFVDKICQSENVHMRRMKDGTFKGSIFVTYKSVEECKKVKESESKKFKEDDEEDLIMKFQKEHQVEKAAENKEKKSGGKNHKEAEGKKDKKFKEAGAVLKFDATEIDDLNFNTVKTAFTEKFEKGVAWVTLNKGDPTVKIRLHGENSAADAIKKLEGKLTIGEKEVELKLVEGEEEEEYWEEFQRDQRNRQDNKRGGGGGRGRGRGGGRGGGRGQRGGHGDKRNGGSGENADEPSPKKMKTESNGNDGGNKRDADSGAGAEPAVKKVKAE